MIVPRKCTLHSAPSFFPTIAAFLLRCGLSFYSSLSSLCLCLPALQVGGLHVLFRPIGDQKIQDPQYTGRTNTSTASCDHATELIGLVSLLQGEVVLRRLRLRLVLKDDGS